MSFCPRGGLPSIGLRPKGTNLYGDPLATAPTAPGHVQTGSTWTSLYSSAHQAYSSMLLMKHVHLEGERLASYWNAFLLIIYIGKLTVNGATQNRIYICYYSNTFLANFKCTQKLMSFRIFGKCVIDLHSIHFSEDTNNHNSNNNNNLGWFLIIAVT